MLCSSLLFKKKKINKKEENNQNTRTNYSYTFFKIHAHTYIVQKNERIKTHTQKKKRRNVYKYQMCK